MAVSKGVSLRREDRTQAAVGFGPGPATINWARWIEFEYKKKGQTKGTKATVLGVEYERDGEKEVVPYGIGNSRWKIEDSDKHGGKTLTPKDGQKGIPDNCNASLFFDSLEDADPNPMPGDYLESPDQLDGIDVVLIAKPIERTFRKSDSRPEEQKTSKPVLLIDEVTTAPWVEGDGKKKNAKAKADDDDEAPAKKSKGRDADDDDEKPTAKSGKGAKSKDTDAEDLDEAAVEALNDLLGDNDGSVKIAEIEKLLAKRLKKEDNGAEIAERAASDDFLDLEKGWERKGSRVVKIDD